MGHVRTSTLEQLLVGSMDATEAFKTARTLFCDQAPLRTPHLVEQLRQSKRYDNPPYLDAVIANMARTSMATYHSREALDALAQPGVAGNMLGLDTIASVCSGLLREHELACSCATQQRDAGTCRQQVQEQLYETLDGRLVAFLQPFEDMRGRIEDTLLELCGLPNGGELAASLSVYRAVSAHECHELARLLGLVPNRQNLLMVRFCTMRAGSFRSGMKHFGVVLPELGRHLARKWMSASCLDYYGAGGSDDVALRVDRLCREVLSPLATFSPDRLPLYEGFQQPHGCSANSPHHRDAASR